MAFHVAEATETDVPRLMEIQFLAFDYEPADKMINGGDTPENRVKAGGRLLNQMRIDPFLHTIKCVHTDPITKTETIVGFCQWHVYDRIRTKEEWMKEHEMFACDWLPEPQRSWARASMLPLFTGRRRMEGRPYALLMYMCVHPDWQRRGAGKMLMRWGSDRTDELGIPAYLEASPYGVPLYKSCGYEDFEPITMIVDGKDVTYPCMVRWPARRSEDWPLTEWRKGVIVS